MDYVALTGTKTTAGSIQQWLNHDGVPSATLLEEAEAWIYQRLRIRQMITSVAGTLTTSVGSFATPARYKQPVFFHFTATSTTAKSIPVKKTLEYVLSNFQYDGDGNQTTGRPQVWAADAANIVFEKLSDKDYPYTLYYYQALPPLSTNTAAGGVSLTTNALTADYPKLVRATCMMLGYEFLKDEREKLYWMKVAEGEVDQADIDSDTELSGVDIAVSADIGIGMKVL